MGLWRRGEGRGGEVIETGVKRTGRNLAGEND